jgi:nucleotide-binding universal stress UspA family protein
MFKKVLVPVDVSIPEDTQNLLQAAADLTQHWDCELHVVTVIPNVGMPIVGSYFDENFEASSHKAAVAELTTALEKANIAAMQHILTGRIYDGVILLAKKHDVDLIVLGAHQPELKDYLLGSNAARIVRHATQSVMVLRDS